MKRWLPSRRESLELLSLTLMILGLQWTDQSWGWMAFFTLGFLWNWAVLNTWVRQQVSEKKYRYSLLRGVTRVHDMVISPVPNRWRVVAEESPYFWNLPFPGGPPFLDPWLWFWSAASYVKSFSLPKV